MEFYKGGCTLFLVSNIYSATTSNVNQTFDGFDFF